MCDGRSEYIMVEESLRMGIAGVFGVSGEHGTQRKVIDFGAGSVLCVGNTYFNHNSLHKYVRVARGQERMGVMSTIDLVLIKRDIVHYVQDVRIDR